MADAATTAEPPARTPATTTTTPSSGAGCTRSTGHPSNGKHAYGGNWGYLAQRLTGYLVGPLCTIWQFTDGRKGFCWTWGLAVGRLAQRRVTQVAWMLLLLLSVGTSSILLQMRLGAVG